MTIGAILVDDYFQEVEPRTVAGFPARMAEFRGMDYRAQSRLSGVVLMFSAGQMTYGILAASVMDTWDDTHLAQVESIIDSIRMGQPGLKATPTRRPHTPLHSATPTPTEEIAPPEEPTEEAQVVAPEPEATPSPALPRPTPARVEGTFVSAREALGQALPVARKWQKTATLSGFQCGEGAADVSGRCRNWMVIFASGTPGSPKGYTVTVQDGRSAPSISYPTDLFVDLGQDESAPPDFLDSPDAFGAFLDAGGAGFLNHHPQARVDLVLRAGLVTHQDFEWQFRLVDGGEFEQGATYSAAVDALQGTIDSAPWPPTKAAKVYTAREALAISQKAMTQYPKARPSKIGAAAVQPGEQGYDAARCPSWEVTFSWSDVVSKTDDFMVNGVLTTRDYTETERSDYHVDIENGRVKPAEYTRLHEGTGLTGEWGDSPAALKAFKAMPDYQAFAESFPSHGWGFEVTGTDSTPGYLWDVDAEVKGARLDERFYLPARAPTATRVRPGTK
jgi:hypothetical protein